MPRLLLSIFLVCCTALAQTHAQDAEPLPSESYAAERIERHDFDAKKWESLKAGIDYSGTKDDKKKPEETARQPQSETLQDDGITGLGSVLKYLSIILAIGVLVFLFVKLASGKDLFGPKNSKLKPAVSTAEIEKMEENLHEAELQDPIQRAVAARDYPLAVRLYYLAVLKELSLRNHIRWKRDKTNGAYLRELAGSPLFGPVQEVTLAFERVWYGKVELASADFDQLEIKLKKAVATVSV